MQPKIKSVLLIALLFLVVAACTIPALQPTESPPTPFPKTPNEIDNNSQEAPHPPPTENASPNKPPKHSAWQDDTLYLGIMIHLEGWADGDDETKFVRHAEIVREAASLFETYDAKLTLESKEFTTGCLRWNDNVLLEMESRGHGIGVHADVGGQKNYSCPRMSDELRQRREELEKLGVSVRHVSGIVSHCDWVNAAVDAGYEFTSGTVKYALESLPREDWPEDFEGCSSPSACHQPYPPELEGRLHPWRARSGLDWVAPNPNGELVILPSGGSLICMKEETNTAESFTKCNFDMKDIDAIEAEMEKALSLVDESKLNTYYLAWSIGQPQDAALLEAFLQRIQPYVDTGQVQWATLPEMYDLFLEWEQNRGGAS